MLMDNNGGATPRPGEANIPSATPEVVTPTAEAMDFGSFANQAEQMQPSGEQASMNVETETNESTADAAPAEANGQQAAPASEPKKEEASEAPESTEMKELRGISIPRNAEKLPKEYVDMVAKIIKADKDDPWQLAHDKNQMTWDMLGKTFNRKLGDGLNGQGVAA